MGGENREGDSYDQLERTTKRSFSPTTPSSTKSSGQPEQMPQTPRTCTKSLKPTTPSPSTSPGMETEHELFVHAPPPKVPPIEVQTPGTRVRQVSPRQHAPGSHPVSHTEPKPVNEPPLEAHDSGLRREQLEPKQHAPVVGSGHGCGSQESPALLVPPLAEQSAGNSTVQLPSKKQQGRGPPHPISPSMS